MVKGSTTSTLTVSVSLTGLSSIAQRSQFRVQDDQEKLHNSSSSFWKRVSMAGLHGAASRRLRKASSLSGDRLPEGSFLRPPMETLCLYWGGVRSRTYALISSRLETSPNGSITLHRSSAFCGSRSLPSLLIYGCVQPVASQRNACVFPSRFIAARNVLAKLILGIVTFFPGVANECLTFISKRNKTSPMNRYIQIPLSDDAEEKIQERKLVEVFLSIATATLKRTDHPALSAVAEKWEAHLIKAEEDLK